MAALIILCIAFLLCIPLLMSIAADSPPTHSPPTNYTDQKPWNVQCSSPSASVNLSQLTELNADITALELRLSDLNELRDLIIADYENEPQKARTHLSRLIALDDKIHKTEKDLRKLHERKRLLQ